jgi:hypothetical protein
MPCGKTVSNIMPIIYEHLYLFICMDLSTALFEWIEVQFYLYGPKYLLSC